MSTRSPHMLPRLIVAGTVLVAAGGAITAATPARASSARLTSSIVSSAQAGTTGAGAVCQMTHDSTTARNNPPPSLPGCPGIFYGNAKMGQITVSPDGIINFDGAPGSIFFIPDQGFTVQCFDPKTGTFVNQVPPDHARPRTIEIFRSQTCRVVPGTLPQPAARPAAKPAARHAHTAKHAVKRG